MAEVWQGGQARILVVDDDERARELLMEVLGRRGHGVSLASDGQKALTLLEEKVSFYDLVITDLNMPRMDGLELLQRIRERSFPVEVILLTSSPGHGMVTRARELGAFAVLSKPCDLEELGCAVESALARLASWKGPAVTEQEVRSDENAVRRPSGSRDGSLLCGSGAGPADQAG